MFTAAVVASAGCGGGGGQGDDRLTKEEFIAQADAICKEANDKLDALGEPANIEEVATFAEDAIAIQEDALARLRALKPPAEDEATLNEAYALLDQQVELGRQIVTAAEAGDVAAIEEIVAQGEPINDQADQIATDYGLKECGND
jgi:hypothetical protein